MEYRREFIGLGYSGSRGVPCVLVHKLLHFNYKVLYVHYVLCAAFSSVQNTMSTSSSSSL